MAPQPSRRTPETLDAGVLRVVGLRVAPSPDLIKSTGMSEGTQTLDAGRTDDVVYALYAYRHAAVAA